MITVGEGNEIPCRNLWLASVSRSHPEAADAGMRPQAAELDPRKTAWFVAPRRQPCREPKADERPVGARPKSCPRGT